MNADTDISSTLLAAVDEQVAGYGHYLVAYSGGLDSTVLLHVMTRLRLPRCLSLRAVYVHHGLSMNADAWAEHCRTQCLNWQVPFDVVSVQVDARDGGIEAAARAARYKVLHQYLCDGEVLLTAQHQDDQSETFLLALKRGSGPAGLASMAAAATLNGMVLQRPLLSISRVQLEIYARLHQLSWVEDDSNADERYDRNFLRRQVLPLLKQRWPHFPSTVARSAALCAEQEQLLDELLAESLAALRNADGALSVEALMPMSATRRFALLRRWLAEQGARMPSREQLVRLWQEVALSRDDANPRLQLGPWQVRRFRHYLYLLPTMQPVTDYVLSWQPTVAPLPLPDNLGQLQLSTQGTWVRQPRHDEAVTVGFGFQGHVQIVGRAHGRPIKKLWQELNVPPWLRERTPLVFYNRQLITAVGRFVTREGAVMQDAAGWFIDWCRPE
ncbi:tRNA lysidine(34) synthetase TilS [Dickeya chrysanthemi]|uniref:tRNA lysidine(34) synthetase TilS n=1 Tax=Dickeya chrysanthemi TaxID=556 RepID=UPI00039DEA1F|nr:tRNA lysidine(34) synthetase TilS [Dickeya chrysanthemi]MBX9446641.1 tRNA lysidine(34) synthetase TilS [Dickeya chrysanthemi]MCA7007893.1 tRNA lysidine(34) synthetase TilS [Dickeya chrysanthemi]